MINPRTHEAMQLFMDGIQSLHRAEQVGLRVDILYVEAKMFHLQRKIQRADDTFKNSKFYKGWEKSADGEVNVASHTQLGKYLYDELGYTPPKLTPSEKGSTDEESILALNIPELTALLSKGKIKKIIDVLDGFYKEQVDGVLHTSFNLHTVVSQRSSSSNVNFQNIPKRDEEAMKICRKALYPRIGNQLLEIDASGMEVRIACTYHKDKTMLKYITDPKSDMHTDMAKQIFMLDDFDKNIPEHNLLRQAAKNGFVFPEFYGDYYKNCAKNLLVNWGKLSQRTWKLNEGVPMPSGTLSDHLIDKGIKSYNSFLKHLKKIEDDFWGNRFNEYAEWKEMWWSLYKKHGFVDMHTGFRCGGLMDKKQCINFPVQGSSFHCLLWAFVEMDKIIIKEKLGSRLIGQIHDSMIFDCVPDEVEYIFKTVKRVFCEDLPNTWKWINIPLEIDAEICGVDEPWSEKKKFELN